MTTALPQSPLGQRLWELFGSYPWAFLLKHDGGLAWKTITRYPLKPRVFWAHWQDAAVALGVRFGHTTQYAVIDIDKGSAYLNEKSLSEIGEALETIGIYRTVPIRSSHSGGLHLYIPLPEPVKTFDLACALKNCLKAFGFAIAEGQLEIMPNTKAFGRSWNKKDFVEYQGHRLPLQPGSGSVMLNHAYQPVGDSLERLFWSWDFAAKAQVLPELLEAMSFAKRHRRKHKRLQTKLEQWRDDLQHEIAEGWTDYGQTNYLLKQFATFGRVFLGLSGEELATYVADRALGSPGYETYCRHQHQINRKALCWARSVENYYYPARSEGNGLQGDTGYPLEPEANGNKARSWDASQRIVRAMYTILSEGTYKRLETITQWATELIRLAGCSMSTLYRNLTMWHPDHSTTLDEFLKLCVMPHQARDTAFSLLCPGLESNPYERMPEPALNGFLTHLGGGMKSLSPGATPLKKLIPEGIGGCGGKGEFSTGGSYA